MGTTLQEIWTKLEGLQVDKEAFKQIEQVEMEKRAYHRMLYLNKIESLKGQISEQRQKKQALMGEREVILKKREAKMAQNSDQKQEMENLKSEIQQIEQRMDTMQRMRTELVSKQIETRAFVD